MRLHAFAAVLAYWMLCTNVCAHDMEIIKAYLDQKKNLYALTGSGKVIRITHHGKCLAPEVSDDQKTVAAECDDVKDGSSVWLFHAGRVRRIKGEPFIRGFKFIQGGAKIAVDKGGLHFAGREYLYEVPSLRLLDAFNQATTPFDELPEWAK